MRIGLFAFISAQSPTPNSLLWRITGNGLKRPSYLYGTIHITDERVFQLGDSLYAAIENAEGLAIEVNPENIAAMVVNGIRKDLNDFNSGG